MFSGLLTHLTRIDSCKTAYGKEYDRLQSISKQAKCDKRKLDYVKNREEILEHAIYLRELSITQSKIR